MSAAGGRITAGAGASVLGEERNQEATCYVGNLDPQVTEELLWELFTQAGPVASVYLPKDRVTGGHQGYGFVEFRSGAPGSGQGSDDAEYASRVLNMVRLHGKPLRVTRSAAWEGGGGGMPNTAGGGFGAGAPSTTTASEHDVGANLFVGGLAPDVDEKALYDTFSAFGAVIATPRVVRDPDTGLSKGFGFVSFDSFEASDAAVEAMNGQFFFNRAIVVTYAFRKDSKSGERHGTPAERLIAAQRRARAQAEAAQRGPGVGGGARASLLPAPHTRFADGPPGVASSAGPGGGAGGGGAPMPMPMPAGMPPPPRMMMMAGGGGGYHPHMPPPPMPYGGGGMMPYGGGGGMMMPPPPPQMQQQMAPYPPPHHGGAPLPPGMPPPPPAPMPMPPPR